MICASGGRLCPPCACAVLNGRELVTLYRFRIQLALLVFGAALLVAACSQRETLALAPAADLPRFLAAAPPRVTEAYRFALANPGALETVPCYCGCNNMGHTSNLSCFLKDTGGDGQRAFDEHAAGCGICVDIAQDVMRLTREGKAPREIRTYVDATYSAFGPATDTPLPAE
ncbi:MAG: hypothetical protein H3C34_02450 [Caldilineaceae bacterium]|nr:hypothetical protein [Caldilineaceae bacterium]